MKLDSGKIEETMLKTSKMIKKAEGHDFADERREAVAKRILSYYREKSRFKTDKEPEKWFRTESLDGYSCRIKKFYSELCADDRIKELTDKLSVASKSSYELRNTKQSLSDGKTLLIRLYKNRVVINVYDLFMYGFSGWKLTSQLVNLQELTKLITGETVLVDEIEAVRNEKDGIPSTSKMKIFKNGNVYLDMGTTVVDALNREIVKRYGRYKHIEVRIQ